MMAKTGAATLLAQLARLGVSHCFANPGTSEMHLVAALDRVPSIKAVLCLFEGVATGAADGFARVAGRPAMTLLHLGPGYANGAANLHNARRAFSPVINIVGDHARDHAGLDAPLASDIAAMARATSIWVGHVSAPHDCSAAASAAHAASLAGGPATLILPADCAWSDAETLTPSVIDYGEDVPTAVTLGVPDDIASVAAAVAGAASPAMLLGSDAMSNEAALAAAAQLSARGIAIYADTFLARERRGHGLFAPRRLPYFAEDAISLLASHDLMILAASRPPVGFFAYPETQSQFLPDRCKVMTLANRGDNIVGALAALAACLPLAGYATAPAAAAPAKPDGIADDGLTLAAIGRALAQHLPVHSIVSDDSVTASGILHDATADAAVHDWLFLTGGAIGQGLPVAIGAALARPDARVVALSGDGAAMYTLQSLWTIAREGLPITVVVLRNDAYRILDIEYQRTGSGRPGPAAAALFDLGNPGIDWVSIAAGMGIKACTCQTGEAFDDQLAAALHCGEPRLLEAVLTPRR